MKEFKSKLKVSAYQVTRKMAEDYLLEGIELPIGLQMDSSNYHTKRKEIYSYSISLELNERDRVKVPEGSWVVKGQVARLNAGDHGESRWTLGETVRVMEDGQFRLMFEEEVEG